MFADYKLRQQGRFAGFSLYVSNNGIIEHSTLCYKNSINVPPLNFTTNCTKYNRYVIFYNERLDGVQYPEGYEVTNVFTELCDVIVQGKTCYLLWILSKVKGRVVKLHYKHRILVRKSFFPQKVIFSFCLYRYIKMFEVRFPQENVLLLYWKKPMVFVKKLKRKHNLVLVSLTFIFDLISLANSCNLYYLYIKRKL